MIWRISVDLKSDATFCVSGTYSIDNIHDLETFIVDLKAVQEFLDDQNYSERIERPEGETEKTP